MAEEALIMLFGEEFRVLVEDDNVGPEEEFNIFKEVFYGSNAGDAEKDEKALTEKRAEKDVNALSDERASSEQANKCNEVESSLVVHVDQENREHERTYVPVESMEPLRCETYATGDINTYLKSKDKCVIQPPADVQIAEDKSCASDVAAKESVEETKKLDRADKPSTKDLPFSLASSAQCLLVDAGWEIERRKRINRKPPTLYFTQPDGKFTFRSLIQAWKAFGETLLVTAPDSEKDENGREWTDVDVFWRDLTDTLSCVQDNSLSILRRWQLLDPFMAMIWIDKRIRALRAGSTIKAAKSTTWILRQSYKISSENIVAKQVDSASGSLTSSTPPVIQKSVVVDGSCYQEQRATQSGYEVDCSKNFTPVPQEDPNLTERNFGIGAAEWKQKRTCATKTVDGPTEKAPKVYKRRSKLEATKFSNRSVKRRIHDTSSEGGNTCDLLGRAGRQEKTTTLSDGSSSQCLEQVESLEEQMDEQVHDSTSVDITKEKKHLKADTKTQLWGRNKKGNLITPHENKQKPILSTEDNECKTLMRSRCKAKRVNYHGSTSRSLKKQKLDIESNNSQNHISDVGISVDDGTSSTVFVGDSIVDEVLASGGASPDVRSNLKITNNIMSGPGRKAKPARKDVRVRIKDDELLITSVFKKDCLSSGGKSSSSSRVTGSQKKGVGKLKTGKGGCRLLPRTHGKGGRHTMDGKGFVIGARTVLCWLIKMGSVSLKDKIQYRDPNNEMVVKTGKVTREGILCSCCSTILSVSEFKKHAGFKQQGPPLSLFLQSDKSYTFCQLQAWSAEYNARKNHMQVIRTEASDDNDDTCVVCGDGGDLVCCDNCPATYHQSCLSTEELPEGNWYCPNCICRTCGDAADGKEVLNSLVVLECSQCGHKYHKTCIEREHPSEIVQLGSSKWFCGKQCHEVYLGFRSRIGMPNHINDGFSWTILRRSHADQKLVSKHKIARMAECNAKLAIALSLMEECFVRMVDPRTGIDMIPHVIYNWGSEFPRLNYQGFHVVVLERGDVLVSVASIRLHGDLVAEMPLIATCSEHRRQGMCRLLLNAIEKLLKSLKVKMLVLSAIPDLLETWTSGFGFKPLEDKDKLQLANINMMKFPGAILLKKNLHEDSTEIPGGNVEFHFGEGQSYGHGELVEMSDSLPSNLSAEKDQSDVGSSSSLIEVPVKQIDYLQRDASNRYVESSLPTTWVCEHGVGSLQVSCVRI